ncbi:MAG: GNAT family N-acetyltransferase [Algoriphagus sp.]|nr:GNAT family N-acetyltransferase [Algoriphagus sp.]
MNQLSIETYRLHLRSLSTSDFDDFFRYRKMPEVALYQSFEAMTKEEAQAFILENSNYHFGMPGEWVQYGIEVRETNSLIGDFALKLDLEDSKLAELGITISPLHQRKGYAKEALLGILNFLFEEYGVQQVIAVADAENVASVSMLTRVGFPRGGIVEQEVFFKGKWGKEYHFSLSKEEWKSGQANRIR